MFEMYKLNFILGGLRRELVQSSPPTASKLHIDYKMLLDKVLLIFITNDHYS